MMLTQTLNGKPVLTGIEAAFKSGLSVPSLNRLVKAGKLADIKRGRDRFYLKAEIEALAAGGPDAIGASKGQ